MLSCSTATINTFKSRIFPCPSEFSVPRTKIRQRFVRNKFLVAQNNRMRPEFQSILHDFWMLFINRTFRLWMLKYIYSDNMNLTYCYSHLNATKNVKNRIKNGLIFWLLHYSYLRLNLWKNTHFSDNAFCTFHTGSHLCTCNIRIQTAYFCVDSIEWLYTEYTHFTVPYIRARTWSELTMNG